MNKLILPAIIAATVLYYLQSSKKHEEMKQKVDNYSGHAAGMAARGAARAKAMEEAKEKEKVSGNVYFKSYEVT